MNKELKRINILGVQLHRISKKDLLNSLDHHIANNEIGITVYPVNTDTLIKANNSDAFHTILNTGNYIIPDGKPILWYAKYLNKKLVELISGAGLFFSLCKIAKEKNYSIFLLGAAEGVGEKAKARLEKKYPGIQITGTYAPPKNFMSNTEEVNKICALLKDSNSTILAVGLGNPLQEEFISKYKSTYKIPISISLGGTIDYAAGIKQMPPDWLGEIGLAWFYRLILEPKRLWKRYFVDDFQIFRLLRQAKHKGKKH